MSKAAFPVVDTTFAKFYEKVPKEEAPALLIVTKEWKAPKGCRVTVDKPEGGLAEMAVPGARLVGAHVKKAAFDKLSAPWAGDQKKAPVLRIAWGGPL